MLSIELRTQNQACKTDSVKSVPGGHTGGAPPVPIPNTEVKPSKADATAAARQWESRTLPGYNKSPMTEKSSGSSLLSPGSETYFAKPTGGKAPIRRDLIERGGTSKFGLDLCWVTNRSLLVKASRLSYFSSYAAFLHKVGGDLSARVKYDRR